MAILLSAHEMNALLPVMDRIVYLTGGRAAEAATVSHQGRAHRGAESALWPPCRRTATARQGASRGRARPRRPGHSRSSHSHALLGHCAHSDRTWVLLQWSRSHRCRRRINHGCCLGDRRHLHRRSQPVVCRARGDRRCDHGWRRRVLLRPRTACRLHRRRGGRCRCNGSGGCSTGSQPLTWLPVSCWGLLPAWLRSSSIWTRPRRRRPAPRSRFSSGSIFTVEPSTIPFVVVLKRVDSDRRDDDPPPTTSQLTLPGAEDSARGVRTRGIGLVFMLAMAVAVGLSSIAIGGAPFSTALLIGPAATALRLTRSIRSSLVVASLLGVATTLLGILFVDDSSFWDPSSQGLPVSFFIVAITFTGYLISGLPGIGRLAGRRSHLGTSNVESGSTIGTGLSQRMS